jgi:uncharacterized Zn finger protein (UPF0148 family)
MTDRGCKQCGANTFSGDGASSCTSCPDGKLSAAGSTSEDECQYGKQGIMIKENRLTSIQNNSRNSLTIATKF